MPATGRSVTGNGIHRFKNSKSTATYAKVVTTISVAFHRGAETESAKRRTPSPELLSGYGEVVIT